ncbi:MAG: bacillithiol biosynthesis cysteine-adding enzyme BshC [Rhodothermales bacterium]
MPETALDADVRCLPFDAFGSFSPLFKAYTGEFTPLKDFYAWDYRDADARRAAAEAVAATPRDRETLVEMLLDQNARWGMDDRIRANIEALRDPESLVVVTGQQVGLFTGPLYTPYKTLTTIQLAQRLTEETGRKVIPVFWLEGGDHDFEEVASVTMLRNNETHKLTYTGHSLPENGNLGPVGRLVLTEQIAEVVDELDDLLPPTDFKPALMEAVRHAYQPGHTLLDAFAYLMRAFFPNQGLVFLSSDDTRLKQMAAPLYRQEIEDYATVHPKLEATSERIAEQFHAQVHTSPTNLFLVEPEGRFPLDADGDEFVLRGTARRFTKAELLDRLASDPDAFSPNVVLRPLTQDRVLPTVAYVAGPGEAAYFAQYREVYAWADIPMPMIYPRASITLVESKVQKVLDRSDLEIPDFAEDLDRLFRRYVLDNMKVDMDALFKKASSHLHRALETVKKPVMDIDASLVKSGEATRATFMKEWNRYKERVVKAEKRNQELVRAQLQKVQVNLYPAGKAQERSLSPLYFANKYGMDLFEQLQASVSLDTTQHQVLAL